jgi:hypothetical protein
MLARSVLPGYTFHCNKQLPLQQDIAAKRKDHYHANEYRSLASRQTSSACGQIRAIHPST